MKGWVTSILGLNARSMMANKAAFWSMSVLMALQNLIYFSLWIVIFSKISSLRGWGLAEVAFLYGAGALGYGVLFSIFGGLNQLAQTIEDGQLDIFLSRPRPALLLALLQRMRGDSVGDIVCGIVMLAFFVRPEAAQIPLLLLLSLSAGMVYMAFRLFTHTLAFWGAGGETAENGFIAFLIASTNPQKGFGFWGKVLLLSVFPAGYIGFLPVEILRDFNWPFLVWQLTASAGLMLFAVWFFHLGLRRYTSGNRFLSIR